MVVMGETKLADALADAEFQKLRAETSKLNAEASQLAWTSWTGRVLIPTLLGSVVAAWASMHFADSLEEKTRAEVRRDVLKTYFDVSNQSAGKRQQILDFVEAVVADDPRLIEWVKHERGRTEDVRKRLEADQNAAQLERQATEQRLQQLTRSTAELVEMFETTQTTVSWLDDPWAAPTRSVPGPVGKILDDAQNEAVLALIEHVGMEGVPGTSYADACSRLASHIGNSRAEAAGDARPQPDEFGIDGPTDREGQLALAEICRADLLHWTLMASATYEGRLLSRSDASRELELDAKLNAEPAAIDGEQP